METINFNVKGMTCGSCVASVERTLQGTPGVASVAVDLPSGTASVVTAGGVGVGTVMLAVFILVTLGLFGAAVRWTTRRRRRVRPTPSQ